MTIFIDQVPDAKVTGVVAVGDAVGAAVGAVVGGVVGALVVRAAVGAGVATEAGVVLGLPDADPDPDAEAAAGLLMVTLWQAASTTKPIDSADAHQCFRQPKPILTSLFSLERPRHQAPPERNSKRA